MLEVEKIKGYIKKLKKEDFYFNKRIKEANAIDDIIKFGYEGNLDGDTIVNFGEYFIVDYYGNDLTICMLTKRKYKNNKGRLVSCKPIVTLVEDCKEQYGTCLNGYWKIPNIKH